MTLTEELRNRLLDALAGIYAGGRIEYRNSNQVLLCSMPMPDFEPASNGVLNAQIQQASGLVSGFAVSPAYIYSADNALLCTLPLFEGFISGLNVVGGIALNSLYVTEGATVTLEQFQIEHGG